MDGISDRINDRQKQRLFDFMGQYYQSLFGKFQKLDGKKYKAELWQRIITDLNAMGPTKTLEQWQRCWRDLKKAAKSKLSTIRKYKRTSGGGVPCDLSLTDQESIIITICNLDSLDGVDGQELGINQTPPHTSSQSVRTSPAVSSSHDSSFHGFLPSSRGFSARCATSHSSDSRRTASVHSLTVASPASSSCESVRNSEHRSARGVRANSPSVCPPPAVSSSYDSSFRGFVPSSSPSRLRTTNHDNDSRCSPSVHLLTETSPASTSRQNSQHRTVRGVRANSRSSVASRRSTDQQSTTSVRNQTARSTSLRGLQGQPWSSWPSFRSTFATARTELNDQQVATAPSTTDPSRNLFQPPQRPACKDDTRSRSVISSNSGVSRNSHASSKRTSSQDTYRENHDRHRSRSVLSSNSAVSRNSHASSQRTSVRDTRPKNQYRHRSRSVLSSNSGASGTLMSVLNALLLKVHIVKIMVVIAQDQY